MTRIELAKWLAELRNPENKQAESVLCTKNGEMCCLGVWLVKVKGMTGKLKESGNYFFNGDGAVLAAGLWENDFYSPGATEKTANYFTQEPQPPALTELNDAGKTFTEIADIIEANPELYVKLED